MTPASRPTAIIAEDEPMLAKTLSRLLAEVWPELDIVAIAEDGIKAVDVALQHTPDVMVLDIKMPGRSGLEVAETVVDDWPETHAEPLIVFVTAFDEFAVSAFERAAVDYILKPATAERLKVGVERLKQRLAMRAGHRAANRADSRDRRKREEQSNHSKYLRRTNHGRAAVAKSDPKVAE